MPNQNNIKALKKAIYTRRSVRKYSPGRIDDATLGKIMEFCDEIKPLYNNIKVRFEMVEKEDVKSILPWITPKVLAFFSQKTDGYLENAGFMLQQMELYIQSLGLGACWLGMGRIDPNAKEKLSQKDDTEFVIMLAFGKTDEPKRTDVSQFRRRPLCNISDEEDVRLEPARLAPSSVNSQPCFFTHERNDAGVLNVYVEHHGLFGINPLADMNRIDVGIAVAHMYVSYPDNFEFFKKNEPEKVKGHEYVGSLRI